MNELGEVLAAWQGLAQAGQQAVLATVVRVQGSAYRRPGARLLLSEAAETTGCVSGGCLEGDLVRRAWWLTRERSVLRRYDTSVDVAAGHAFGLGCNGIVDVLLERLDWSDEPAWLGFLAERQRTRRPAVLASALTPAEVGWHLGFDEQGRVQTFTGSLPGSMPGSLPAAVGAPDSGLRRAGVGLGAAVADVLAARRSTWVTVDAVGWFVEYVAAPRPVVIFGGGRDVGPLVELCAAQGWHVTVVDPHTTSAPRGRLSGADQVLEALAWPDIRLTADTLCVVMTHNFATDRDIVRYLLDSPVSYIGVLGPRARTEQMLADDSEHSFGCRSERLFGQLSERLFAPAGLDIGGEGPAAVALSIVAEMQAVAAGRCGSSLCERPAPLHGAADELSLRLLS